MIIIGSEQLCEFRYQDNTGDRKYCSDVGLYRQLEVLAGSTFFKGNFSRNSNHRLLGTVELINGSIDGINTVIDPIGITGCEFTEPCFELKINYRLKGQKNIRAGYYIPLTSFSIQRLIKSRNLNYADELNDSLREESEGCIVGVIPSETYFAKVTINPRTDNTDSKIREKFKDLDRVDEDTISGISMNADLERILNVISRTSR